MRVRWCQLIVMVMSEIIVLLLDWVATQRCRLQLTIPPITLATYLCIYQVPRHTPTAALIAAAHSRHLAQRGRGKEGRRKLPHRRPRLALLPTAYDSEHSQADRTPNPNPTPNAPSHQATVTHARPHTLNHSHP
ncbi:uncharacterized protein K452DRAFT_78852 [Aplosporella prunicola CBS 121167]|uniref:Uncharacterized protein n=1 Tax=Aplosporella prunicola CBS 121167 TaxID=1176127 RepID=A0A6A6B538_9PEZI|nr:uncharacterized protein K452DRAFT_78852 [Aplosporella prunicola CBS 121167]KAF2138966.1 hypothetical protein K452DRAFT_78852 [Aplosporella prunicola CBS 121167]